MSWVHGALARARLLLARRSHEDRIAREFAFHVEMETERLVRERQLPQDEARRQALLAFGPGQWHREALRDGRGLQWLDSLRLDFTIGLRVLRKYPGLTLVAVIGIGMAVAIAATMFTMVELTVNPRLPLPHGDRLVGIQTWDRRANAARNATLPEYDAYGESLSSADLVGAFRMGERNLILPDSTGGEVFSAAMTATAFRVAGTAPLLGRPLVESDEAPGSPPVILISHELWRSRFRSDPGVIGTVVRLGAVPHTVVGVMPRGFAFPVSQDAWTALQVPVGSRTGTAYLVARLRPGHSSGDLQVEASTVASRLTMDDPMSRRDLEARVVDFPTLVGAQLANEEEGLRLVPLLISLILVAVCVNVATLVYARTASRATEIAVRASLGATRGRIVGQLFVEALVLAAAGSLLGLLVSRVAFRLIFSTITAGGAGLPFWFEARLTPALIAYVVALTLLAALIVGVLPARSAALAGSRAALSQLSKGGSSSPGRGWTALIVTQVGIAVAVLPGIVMLSAVYGYYSLRDVGFATSNYLTAVVEFDRVAGETLSPTDRLARLEQRLEAEPGVAAATWSSDLVGLESVEGYELEAAASDSTLRRRSWVRTSTIAMDYLEQFGIAVRVGRGFSSGDRVPGSRSVLVNEEFVREVLGGRSAIGHRIRRADVPARAQGDAAPDAPNRTSRGGTPPDPDRWLEIVGVVANFPPERTTAEATESRVYEPMQSVAPGGFVMLTASTTSPPASLGNRVQQIGLAVDPGLRINRLVPLDVAYRQGERGLGRLVALMMAGVTLSILLLSAAGMSSLMSFTVTRRTREIGIRSALGADAPRLRASVFARVLRQLGAGCGVGLCLAWGLNQSSGGELLRGHGALAIAGVVVLVFIAGLGAAWGPARRGLRVHPADALRSE